MWTEWIMFGICVILLVAVSWGLEIRTITKDRRKVDFYRAYNEQEDRTEALFDRREETHLD